MVKLCAVFAIFSVILGRFSQFLRDFACFCAKFRKSAICCCRECSLSGFALAASWFWGQQQRILGSGGKWR